MAASKQREIINLPTSLATDSDVFDSFNDPNMRSVGVIGSLYSPQATASFIKDIYSIYKE
jgi:hypothetical protein